MSKNDVIAATLQLTRRVLPLGIAPESVAVEAKIREELGIGSLGLISLMFLIEEDLGLDLQPYATQMADCQTVGDVAEIALQALTLRSGSDPRPELPS